MGWHFSFRRRRNKNKASSSNGKAAQAEPAAAGPSTEHPRERQSPRRSRNSSKETPRAAPQAAKENAPPACPLVVTASIRFPDSGVGSLYSREYRSSPDFDPTERICRGLLRRIEYGSEELITRKDSSALDHNGQHSSKPLRYEMHFKIVRHGGDVWAERTFKSYQKHPVFYHAATELAAATHRLIGLYLHQHDTGFKWTGDPLRDYLDEPEVAKPTFVGPLSLNSVPRDRFLETSQSFEFVPGFTIEIAFRSRSQQRTQQDWKRTSRLSSKQATPLNLGCAEELLYQSSKAVNEEYDKIKADFDSQHQDCEMVEGAVGCHHFEQDALEIDLRIFNNLGPDFDHLRRSIRTRLALFCNEDGADCERFLRALQSRLSEHRDRIDEQLSQMNDFDFRILELSGHGWRAKDAARFTFDSSVSRSRRTIEATLDRVQTGVVDVLRGQDVAAHIGAYKRGHHVLDKALIARSATGVPTETIEDPEAQKVELISRLEARIQEDLEMICKDTCSLADIPDEKPQQLDEPVAAAKEEAQAQTAEEEEVPDVIEVPVSEYSAAELPMESVSEMPTPPATPPGPRYFPLVPLKYRPEIPVRTSSASSHFSGILGVPGEVYAAREEASPVAPESPVEPESTCVPNQGPDGTPILTRDFGHQDLVPHDDGQVLRRKASSSDLKAGVEDFEQDVKSREAVDREQEEIEFQSSMSVRSEEAEVSEPTESLVGDLTTEASPPVGTEAAVAPDPTVALLSSLEVEPTETEPRVAESTDEPVQSDLTSEKDVAPSRLDAELGATPDQLQAEDVIQQEFLDISVEEAKEHHAEKDPENDLAVETPREADIETSRVEVETPASLESSAEPANDNTDTDISASTAESVIEPVHFEVHETTFDEEPTQDREEAVLPEHEDSVESDNVDNSIPDVINEQPAGQLEVSKTESVGKTSVTEDSTEVPVVEQTAPFQDYCEDIEPAEPLMEAEEESIPEAIAETSNFYEDDNADGAGTSHKEADAPITITQISPLPLVEPANELCPSPGPITVGEAESKVDTKTETLTTVETLHSNLEVEEKPDTDFAEEVEEAPDGEALLPFETDLGSATADIEMPGETESPPEPDTPVPEQIVSASSDSSDDRERPQTPPDVRDKSEPEEPVTPCSRESDNESLAPSTPALSCGDDNSPETSFLTTPVLQRSSVIQEMPALADEEIFTSAESQENKPESTAKPSADLEETPVSDKALLDFPATGVSSATELVHFASDPEVLCPVPSAPDKHSVKLWNAENVREATFEDDFSRTKSDYAFDHEADLFSSDDGSDDIEEEAALSPSNGDFATSQVSVTKEQLHVRDGRHSAIPEPPERRMSETEADCDTDGAEGDERNENNMEAPALSEEQSENSILPYEIADLHRDIEEAPVVAEPAEPDTSEEPVDPPVDEEHLQFEEPDGAEKVIECDMKHTLPTNLPANSPAPILIPSDPEQPEPTITESSGPDNTTQEQYSVQSAPQLTLIAAEVTRTLTTKSSTSSSGWEDCSSFVSATTRPRDSVDTVHSLGRAAEEEEDSLPPLHATTGYLGLHESRLVEYGLRGALTGSQRFDAAFLARPSTAPATPEAVSEARETRSATSSSRTLRLRRQRRAHSAAVVTGAHHHHHGKRAARRTPVEKERTGGKREARRSASLPPARERKTRPEDEEAAMESSESVLPRMMRMFSGFRGRH